MKLSAPISAAAVLLLLSPLSAPAARVLSSVRNADAPAASRYDLQQQTAAQQTAIKHSRNRKKRVATTPLATAQSIQPRPAQSQPADASIFDEPAPPPAEAHSAPAPVAAAATPPEPSIFDEQHIRGTYPHSGDDYLGGQSSEPAGFGPLDPAPPANGVNPQALIASFGDREAAFAKARDQYTFRQSVRIDTISDDTNRPDGTYQQVTDIVFDDTGRRSERVVSAPANTLERLIMTQADFDDIAHRLPFVLTTPELPQYDLTYLGRQRVDDIDTYVFDCRPRTLEKNKRYFQGRVWVDQQQNEIVLINGKSVPDNLKRGHEDLSPPYTTYYQEVDGGNWFPVYTKADGILHFSSGQGGDVHIRYVVRYEDYKRFHAKSRIIYNGQDLPPAAPDSQTSPNQNTPNQPEATPTPAPDNPLPPPDPNAPSLKRPTPKPR